MEFASDYVAMGEDLEEKQSDLNSACSAWNIANLPPNERGGAAPQYLDNFRGINTLVQVVDGLKEDIELLIDTKLRMFPDAKNEIISAEISELGGTEHIRIASMPPGAINKPIEMHRITAARLPGPLIGGVPPLESFPSKDTIRTTDSERYDSIGGHKNLLDHNSGYVRVPVILHGVE